MEHQQDTDPQKLIAELYDENFQPLPVYKSKRIMDVALSGTLLALSAPVALAATAAIKIEGLLDRRTKGPVLFSQERYGRYGKPFKLYKFRTMIDGAESQLDDLLCRGGGMQNVMKIENDPRVTRVGRFLRNRHLDEIPQLLNVLFGDMSLVGPRPLDKRRELVFLEKGYTSRYRCTPGLTGPFQTCDRKGIDVSDVNRMENDYVHSLENGYSIWLDAGYILKTIPRVLFRGAYSE